MSKTGSFQKVVSYGVTSDSLGEQWWSKLNELANNLVLVDSEDQLGAELSDADALLLSLGRGADRELIESAPALRYIGMLGTGYGRIDTDAARGQDVTVTNVADYSTEGVAEFVFAILLAELRELQRAQLQAQAGSYDESSYQGTEVASKSIGILGLGNIGRRVAELGHGFGSSLTFWSRTAKDLTGLPGIQHADTPEDVLEGCDVVSIHLEHNADTDGFLSADRLDRLQDGAVLINTAPMELCDLEALEKHLAAERFSFILDHSDEMKPEDVSRLASYSCCTVYPPIAYTTVEASEAKREIFVTNMTSFLSGSEQNVVS